MGNYNARKQDFLKAWQINAAHYMFSGLDDKDLIPLVWPQIDPGDEKKIKTKMNSLRNLRNNPKFQEYYQTIIKEWQVHNIGKALRKISEQIDAKQPWLANKAANDVLQHSKDFLGVGDDNTVVVKFEGGFELGSPDQDEE